MTPRTPSRPQPIAAPSVREAIKQTKPFSSVSQEGILALFLTADAVRRTFAQLIEEHVGLTLQQYNVLRILRGAGPDGLPTLEIGGRMIEQAPGVTRLLDRLEGKGLVRRQRCPSDRRQVLCWITPAGAGLLQAMEQTVEEAGRRALGALGRDELDSLVRALDAIRSAP